MKVFGFDGFHCDGTRGGDILNITKAGMFVILETLGIENKLTHFEKNTKVIIELSRWLFLSLGCFI